MRVDREKKSIAFLERLVDCLHFATEEPQSVDVVTTIISAPMDGKDACFCFALIQLIAWNSPCLLFPKNIANM